MLKAERSYHKLISRRVETAAAAATIAGSAQRKMGWRKRKKHKHTHKRQNIARNIGMVNAANADNYTEIALWAQAKTILI